MATFNSLPNEILTIIADFFPCRSVLSQSQYLGTLALTNRRLYQLVNPILYAHNRDKDHSSAVIWAARHGRIETLEKALFFGLNFNCRDDERLSCLCIAVIHKQEATVTWLLNHGVGPDVEPVIERFRAVDRRFSPLFLALKTAQSSVACLLLERGAFFWFAQLTDFDDPYEEPNGQPILSPATHYASFFGLIPVVRFLVQHKGVDINTRNSEDEICLHHAIRGRQNRAVIDELILLGADINHNGTSSLLCLAIEICSYKHAHWLIDAGARIDVPPRGRPAPIHMCTWRPLYLLEDQQSDKYTLLERLINLGADVNGFDLENQSRTPLGEACLHGTVTAVSMLLQAGAEVDLDIGEGKRPLDSLLALCHAEEKQSKETHQKILLLIKNKARLDSRTWQNMSPLEHELVWSMKHDNSKRLAFMLGSATSQNLSTEHLDSLLETAIEERSFTCCRVLQEYGARMQSPTNSIISWVEEALQDRLAKRGIFRTQNSDFRCFIAMAINLSSGFDDETKMFIKALNYEDREAADVFLSRGMVGRRPGCYDPNEWLQAAAAWGHLGVLRRLLQGSPNVNGFDDWNMLPLSRAIEIGNREAAILLMEHGADAFKSKTVQVGQETRGTLKPIQLALRYGEIEILKAILDKQQGSLTEEEAWVPAVLASAPEIAEIVSMELC
ncbi:ankyrin repeat-containing domain protein [Annulohypoxylon truncatum]|uniref:ankyrin repeat-containing domain protein n=1 Tax=Annulohypoxylon truncatum TaxID=327061 RepID=UPI00200895BF|nr:ankyrin repeat-containing domain protein [Annulohypoxylon truncatum]KAI1205892.1 ankyrin repeat-containing domain protein [Annulohypoxylon truncatum]